MAGKRLCSKLRIAALQRSLNLSPFLPFLADSPQAESRHAKQAGYICLFGFLPLLFFLALGPRASAQESPYIVTHDHYLEEPGNLEVEYFSTFGTQRAGNDFHAFWIEFEYGATAWWTTEVYLDGQETLRDSTLFTGFRWENRFRPLKEEHFINPVIYAEYEQINGADKIIKEVEGHDVESDNADRNSILREDHNHELEFKLLLSKSFRGWNVAVNPPRALRVRRNDEPFVRRGPMKARTASFHTALIAALLTTFPCAFDTPLAFGQSALTLVGNKWSYVAIQKAPEKARAKHNPLASDSDAAAGGGKLFEQHCEECHGKKAEGGKRGPSLLREEVQRATPGTLFWILTNGVVRRGMPDWSKLPEPERWQIVAFLKSFKASGGRSLPAFPE